MSPHLYPISPQRRLKRWQALLAAAAVLAIVLAGSHLHPWGFAPGV